MKIVATYNIKGGVGKTAAAVNLGHLAAADGQRVLIADLDPQAAASFLFRVRPRVKGGGTALIRGSSASTETSVDTANPAYCIQRPSVASPLCFSRMTLYNSSTTHTETSHVSGCRIFQKITYPETLEVRNTKDNTRLSRRKLRSAG